MKLKILSASILAASCLTLSTSAAVTFDFTGNNSYDGETSLIIPLNDLDTGNSTSMTVNAGGGTFNSNAGDFGVDSGSGTNDLIDGTAESITITFGDDILFNFIDLGGVGSTIADGANLTIGITAIDLFTGVTGFNGTSDIYTPTSPVALSAGDSIILTGSQSSSVFDLETINVTVVPEPGAYATLAGILALSFVMFRRRR